MLETHIEKLFIELSVKTGLLLDIKIKSKHQVLTEEKLDETDAGLEHSPWESLRHLAYETRV
jgi:hypothetical protein